MAKEMKKAKLNLEVFGRVQGVGFRQNMVKKANSLSIKGYVANKKEGSVVAEAEGDEESLREYLSWAQKGEFPARVTGMSFHWGEFEGEYDDFKVRKNESTIVDDIKGVINLGKRVLHPHEKMNIPNHVVIIPDGNRRWARKRGWKAYVGHKRGGDLKRLLEIFNSAKSFDVKYLSLWVLSTENWLNRDPKEVEQIFGLFRKNKEKLEGIFQKENVRFRQLGRKDRLPEDLINMFNEWEESTKNNEKLNLQICIDYGGRNSIVDAVKRVLEDQPEELDEEKFAEYLETNEIPDPDLIIRTAGEKRLSGIMPYEGVYSELYFTDIPFPEFDQNEFSLAIYDYSARKRNFGGTNVKHLEGIDEEKLVDPDEKASKLNVI